MERSKEAIMKNKIVELYQQGFSTRQIENFVPIKKTRINSILLESGITMKSKGNSYKMRRYDLNESYFEMIDTEDKAYWLGFILADGHVSDECLTIGLAEKDIKPLKKFLTCIKSDSPIKFYKSTLSVKINLYSLTLVQSLRKLGLERNKSKTAIFPDIHFWYIISTSQYNTPQPSWDKLKPITTTSCPEMTR